ncbi:hypothetical protein HZZ00_32070 [Streptomyces sp. NEAU-sy36]|uniref:hypothetical protein n=1 Tax=unclassified Streptomyces TaxID=2593676 RepID=UPI0015D5E7F3|nr:MULTISPECIES: hypothetical protein [unclassified Streptomyces]QLJ05205.1 hypothetical protein HZZ00_32070 [Streptomyces sp. NEAU-sy36]
MQAVHALSRFGELAWFKLPAEYNDVYKYFQVPYMGWRYKTPRNEVTELIEGTVAELPTQIEWLLDRTRRNWVLLPGRVQEEAHGLMDPSFSETVHSISSSDQEFCLKALADFNLIIKHLENIRVPEVQ